MSTSRRISGRGEDPGYWTIAERMLDGFYRCTVKGDVVRCSPKAVRLMGYDSADEMVGKVSMAEMWVYPEERDLLLEELREHGEARGFEATLNRKDGSHVRVELTVVPWLSEDGELLGTDGIVRDVSERSRSEQQFRSLIRNSPGAMFRFVGGEERRYTFMSEAIEQITGYPPQHFTGRRNPLAEIIHPEDQEAAETLRNLDLKAGKHYDFEFRILTPGGETRWVEIRGTAALDRISELPTVDGVIVDVTEAHRLADELAERERQVQTLIRNVPGAIYRFAEQEDGVWRFDLMSPAIEKMTGYPPEHFVSQADPFVEILHPEDRQRVDDAVGHAIATNGDFDFEHRVLHRAGGVRWIRVQGSMSQDSATGRRHVDGVQLDVTDLHEAQEAVERSEAMFRHLFDSMAEGYFVAGADSRVRLCNAAAVRILGYPNEQALLGTSAQELIVDAAQRRSFIESLQRDRVFENMEADVRCHDGSVITLQFSTRLVGEGENQQTETTFRDISEQKRIDAEIREARHAAERANRAKSTFLANMSHELRTPLNAIIGYSEMMMEEAEDLEEDIFSEDLKKVHTAGTHLLALINDVLDLSKIEAGRSELFLEDFSLVELINSVTATAEPLMAKNQNEFRVQVAEDVTLHQDLTKLRQSLLNLLSNAAKFTHQGTVTLTARNQRVDGADWLELAVSDTGIGVAPEKHAQLFDEFSQADASTTREYGGTGLGLAISRRFCGMMGGDIGLESAEGEGSTFTIRVPVRCAEPPPAPAAAAAEPMLPREPGRTVLVIDDDPEACDIISRHLTRSGFEAITALTGAEGLRLAREVRPCAITLDVMMPEMDGWSVLNALKADPVLSETPVIMVSMIDDKSTGYTLGATSYLTKPVDRDALLKSISAHVGGEGRALIIEDDADTRSMLRRVLERTGIEVVEAGNGREGLAVLETVRPDIVLLDLMMPVMDGFEFVLKLRAMEAWRELPVVVITAKDLSEAERELLSGQVQNVLEKGAYSREQLLSLVRSALTEVDREKLAATEAADGRDP